MLIVNNVKAPLGAGEEEIVSRALHRLRIRSGVEVAYLSKSSLDARNQHHIQTVSTVIVRLRGDEARLAASLKDSSVLFKEEKPLAIPRGTAPLPGPVVVAGLGPAGIFAASMLARHGYRPLVLERGWPVEERVKAVERFWQEGKLEPDCNVQFGEGGAGTFSDGKLTTRISDPLCSYVLEEFGRHGAPEETLHRAKPHIGTDLLRQVVASMRREILENGGEVRFSTPLTGLRIHHGRLAGVEAGGEVIPAGQLVLAVGHSARDTFRMLLESGLAMEQKPFSVGARVEHLQRRIDEGLYGKMAGHPALPPGEYQLSHRVDGQGVYTFCMCPGGLVVPSSSAPGQVVTNGMSEYRRDRDNANAALVVGVDSRDFGSGILDGMNFQEELERRAFQMAGAGYRACGVTAGNFLEGKTGLSLKAVQPSYSLGVEAVDFDRLFPRRITEMMRLGLRVFDRKLPGFGAADTVLTGPETRTSSPVRILRGENLQAAGAAGLYPCGEGAGYAGGIMSAAVDGLRVALAIMEQYAPPV